MQTIIQTPTPKLADSLAFYQQLGLQACSTSQPNLYSDGKAIIEINPDRHARAGLKLYQDSWSDVVAALTAFSGVLQTAEGYLLTDPSGTWIYLMEQPAPIVDLSDIPTSALGNFAGISMEVLDLAKAISFWEIFGFQKTMGGVEQGWVSLTDEAQTTISIMKAFACPHLFFNPSLSYFNGKENLAIIAELRARKIPITEEITFFNPAGIVDNVIVRDPGGLGFFVFSD